MAHTETNRISFGISNKKTATENDGLMSASHSRVHRKYNRTKYAINDGQTNRVWEPSLRMLRVNNNTPPILTVGSPHW